MDATTVVQILVLLGAGALIVYLFVVLRDFRRTLSSIDELARHMDEQLLPLTSKANQALDEINEELVRIDGIVSTVEDMSHRVNSTTDVVRHALSSPLVKIASWSAGMKKAVTTLAHHEESAQQEEEGERRDAE